MHGVPAGAWWSCGGCRGLAASQPPLLACRTCCRATRQVPLHSRCASHAVPLNFAGPHPRAVRAALARPAAQRLLPFPTCRPVHAAVTARCLASGTTTSSELTAMTVPAKPVERLRKVRRGSWKFVLGLCSRGASIPRSHRALHPTPASPPTYTALQDYAPTPYLIPSVHLDFDLHEDSSVVKSKLRLVPNHGAAHPEPLFLNGAVGSQARATGLLHLRARNRTVGCSELPSTSGDRAAWQLRPRLRAAACWRCWDRAKGLRSTAPSLPTAPRMQTYTPPSLQGTRMWCWRVSR